MMRSMDKTSLKLTVIMPVYKTEPYLRKCIDSILGQTLTDFELILVDDGSPDNCPAICDEYAKADGRIRVIHKENGGQGLARKLALGLAKGEYIGFVDSDDWIEPEMFEVLYRAAVDQSCDMVICDLTYHYLKTHTTVPYTQSQSIRENYLYDSDEIREHILSKVLLEEIHCFTWNKLYRSSILKQCNLDKTVGLQNNQDWVLNCEYFKKIQRMMYLNKCLYNYAVHQDGSLRGKYKDYLSVILRLHELRMTYLKEYNMDGRNDIRRSCIGRFMNMALFAAFDYEFLFMHTTFREKLQSISAVVNHAEVRRNLNEHSSSVARSDIFCRMKWALFRIRMPLLIYGFVKSSNMARRIKQGFRDVFSRTLH
jgi:glycosyltransferase involved in cell wall biosynthesis